MSEFERPQPGYRLAETQYGDTLPVVAARELGDGNRWVELVWLNRLVPPYLTDDPDRLTGGLILTGQLIRIPTPAGYVGTDSNERSYEQDCALVDKQLQVTEGGDFAILKGVDNLRQQLTHRVVTPRGQAIRHPDYGCLIWRLVGKANGPIAGLLGSEYVRSALLSDYRVAAVTLSRASVEMDAIKITTAVTAIDGGSTEIAPLDIAV